MENRNISTYLLLLKVLNNIIIKWATKYNQNSFTCYIMLTYVNTYG
jgi:hypothetical protein